MSNRFKLLLAATALILPLAALSGSAEARTTPHSTTAQTQASTQQAAKATKPQRHRTARRTRRPTQPAQPAA